MPSYPSSIWAPPVRGVNLSNAVTQTDILDQQNAELVAMQTELGLSPSGTDATVAARIAESIRVAGRWTVTGFALPDNAFTTINVWAESIDTHNMWASGSNFTVGRDGFYTVTMSVDSDVALGDTGYMRITANGVSYSYGTHSVTDLTSASIAGVQLLVGNIITFGVYQNTGAVRSADIVAHIARLPMA